MSDDQRPLEPNRATQERWLRQVSAFALDHVAALERGSALGEVGSTGAAIAKEVSTEIPETPLAGGIEQAIGILDRALEASLVTPGPGYLAYIPGGGLYTGALADFAANCFNRYTGLSQAAPGLVRLEADTLAWLAREFGYGDGARGLFTSGSSLANFSAVVTARHDRLGETADLRQAVVYTSTQAHHSVAKSVFLAGIPHANVRGVAVDQRHRLDVSDLERAILSDRSAGLQPFLLVSSAGTTNTGALDPLRAIADTCATHDLWHHVDGAYGGAFALCPEGKQLLAGIERADSVSFDPHKGMFLPYGTGCLLVREGEKLRNAHHEGADYLQDLKSDELAEQIPSPAEHGPELTRSFRGLRVWLSLMMFGAGAFRAALTEKLALARRFHAALERLRAGGAAIEIVDAPQLSTVVFRPARAPSEALVDWNGRCARFHDGVNQHGRVYLSSTMLPAEDGAAFASRVCVLSFRTHADRIDMAAEDVAHALDAVC